MAHPNLKDDPFPKEWDRLAFEEWFTRQINIKDIAGIKLLTARMALRALPTVHRLLDNATMSWELTSKRLFLPWLRCYPIALGASSAPQLTSDLNSHIYAANARTAASNVKASDPHASIPNTGAVAAQIACFWESEHELRMISLAAKQVFASSIYSLISAGNGGVPPAFVCAALQQDYKSFLKIGIGSLHNSLWPKLDSEISSGYEAALSLYPTAFSGGLPTNLRSEISNFFDMFRSLGGDWNLWLEWYQGVLNGEKDGRYLFGLPTERALRLNVDIALIPEEFWQSPAKANAEIRRLVEVARGEVQSGIAAEGAIPPGLENIYDEVPPEIPPNDLPAQNPRSATFVQQDDGRIGRGPVQPEQRLATTPVQLDRYAELRLKLQALLELGENTLGAVAKPARDFDVVLVADIHDANADLLWARANKLRRLWRAHELALQDKEPNPARLSFDAGEALGDLIDMYNVLAFGDGALTLRDATRFGPRDRADALAELKAAKPISDAALQEKNVVNDEARRDLDVQDENVRDLDASLHSDQAIEQIRIAKHNFVTVIIGAAHNAISKLDDDLAGKNGGIKKETTSWVYKGVLTGIASASAYFGGDIINFVSVNSEILRIYATTYLQNSSAVRIIDWIKMHAPPRQ